MSSPSADRSTLRAAVERHSSGLLAALHRQPRWLLPVVSALLLGGVVFLPVVPGLACLLLLLALVGWLSYLSWPVADTRGRVARVVSLALLVALGLRLLG